MNRLQFTGATLLISGTLLFGIIHLALANYIPNMGGWSDPPGKLAMARDETSVNFPYYLSMIFIFTGLILLFLKELKALINLLINE